MNCLKVDLELFLSIENSILHEFSRSLFDLRHFDRAFMKMVLRKNKIETIQIQAQFKN